jgi:hypothetical protein
MAQKIKSMDEMWLNLGLGIDNIKRLLNGVLEHAERFWFEFELAQGQIHLGRQQLSSAVSQIEAVGQLSDQTQIKLQMDTLKAEVIPLCSTTIQRTHQFGEQLCEFLGTEDENQFVQKHLMILDTQWTAFINEYARFSAQFTQSSDQVI